MAGCSTKGPRGGLIATRPSPNPYDSLVKADARGLFELLRSLDLPVGDYAVFGSGPLIIRGIIEASNDLDVISRGPAWDRALAVGETVDLPTDGTRIVHCFNGAITIGRSWAYGTVDIDELIDTAEIIDGIPFVRVEHVIAYKEIADRPKDRDHLRRLARHSRTDVQGRAQRPSF
jgi:hypothetical protein